MDSTPGISIAGAIPAGAAGMQNLLNRGSRGALDLRQGRCDLALSAQRGLALVDAKHRQRQRHEHGPED
jgi:hypothetical protein